MSLPYFLLLFFKYFSIVLGNVGESRGRHDNTKVKAKTFLFCLCIIDLDTIMEFLDKLNRTLKAQS